MRDLGNGKEYIWANIWGQDAIVKINIETGIIEKRINMGLLDQIQLVSVNMENTNYGRYDKMNYILNGIAYDPIEDVFYLTGKMWNFVYKVKIY